MFRDNEFLVDSVAIPPANPASIRVGNDPSLYAMRHDGGVVTVDQIWVNGATYRQFSWQPGSNKISARSSFEPETDETIFQLHLTAATLGMMLTLMNSPSLVESNTNGQRQERRAANRLLQLPVDAWYRVRWRTAADNGIKQSTGDDTGARMPLHYRRGHVRKAQPHFSRAFETDLTGTGWGQWIDGIWVGHPAFGIKKSIFSPILDEAGLAEFARRKRLGAR